MRKTDLACRWGKKPVNQAHSSEIEGQSFYLFGIGMKKGAWPGGKLEHDAYLEKVGAGLLLSAPADRLVRY